MRSGAPTNAPPRPSRMRRVVDLAILHLDLEGSESWSRQNNPDFVANMERLRSVADEFSTQAGRDDGQGDEIWRAYQSSRQALMCAFALLHACRDPDRILRGLRPPKPRILLHWGEFSVDSEGRVLGPEQVTVKRLDEAVQSDEVWATRAFASAAGQHPIPGVRFDYVGRRELDKGSGSHPCFRVQLVNSTSESVPPPYDIDSLARSLYRSGQENERLDAIEALATLGTTAAASTLVAIANDGLAQSRVRQAALAALQDLGSRVDSGDLGVLRTLAVNFIDKDAELAALTLLAAGATGDESTVSLLCNAVQRIPTSPTRVREAALLAMRSFDGKLISDAVLRGLNDDSDTVRIAACVAAEQSRTTADVIARMVGIVKNPDEAEDLRVVASEALANQPAGQQLVNALADFAKDRELPRSVRLHALEGLAHADAPHSRAAIYEVAMRTDDDARTQALLFLSSIAADRHITRRQTPQMPTIAKIIEMRRRPLGPPARNAS
jgi:HEAT repeat protein